MILVHKLFDWFWMEGDYLFFVNLYLADDEGKNLFGNALSSS